MYKKENRKISRFNQAIRLLLFIISLSVVFSGTVPAKTITKKVTVETGKRKKLHVSEKQDIVWKSDNKKIVKVSRKGLIRGLKAGKAVVTAKAEGNNKYRFKVTVKETNKENDKNSIKVYDRKSQVVVKTPSGKLRYKKWKQKGAGSFVGLRGCSLVATAIVGSAFGDQHSPKEIWSAPAKAVWGERYACKKLGVGYSSNGVLGLKLCGQILEDMGCTVSLVRTIDPKKSVKEITDHVQQGKPVIFMCHNKTYKGIRVANSLHAMVLVAIDADGKGVFIDPYTGKVNYAHHSKNFFKLTVKEFVGAFCKNMTGNGIYFSIGGYLMVG